MPGIARRGIVARHHLNEREMAEIEQLMWRCNTYEDIRIQLDYNMLTLPMLPTDDMFLAYNSNQLVGCLLLDRFHTDVKEITGMVDPDFRRQGIFMRLLETAIPECKSRGIQNLLFICDAASSSGKAFMQARGAKLDAAEHHMLLQDFQLRETPPNSLQVREATPGDMPALATILGNELALDTEQSLARVQRLWQRPDHRFYLATINDRDGPAQAIGTLRVEETPQEMVIYGFIVEAAYRQRGYGRQLLEKVITTTRRHTSKPIALDVDIQNIPALTLYQSMGFVIEHTYGYYKLTLTEPDLDRTHL